MRVVLTYHVDEYCMHDKMFDMEASALGHNLRRLRDSRSLSQADVAKRASLSRVAYGAIESGASSPRVETLLRIAEVLDVKVQDLLSPPRGLKAVRFRATKRMNSREQILLDVGRWLENYAELEELVGERIPYFFDDMPVLKRGPDRARATAVEARKLLKLGTEACIRDICGLLEQRAGIKVYPVKLSSDTFFGLSVAKDDGGPAVVVNTWDRISVERWIFTAAHELGHLLLHLAAYKVDEPDENPDEEKEADRFASHFLMPEDVFKREWNDARGLSLVDRVHKVKQIFKVSYKTVLYRLSEDKAYGKDIWGHYYRAYQHEHGRSLLKTDEPHALPPDSFQAAVEARAADEPKRITSDLFVEDRLSALVRVAVDKELITVGRAAEILEIDLKQMRARIASWVA